MQLGIDVLVNGLVVVLNLLLGVRVEEEDFLYIVLNKPVDGVINGGEVPQFDKGLAIMMITLVLSKSL